jgi:hypothetical protein
MVLIFYALFAATPCEFFGVNTLFPQTLRNSGLHHDRVRNRLHFELDLIMITSQGTSQLDRESDGPLIRP